MSICDCCQREVAKVRGSPWHGASQICLACFYVWYDCGLTNPQEVALMVLECERTRKYPFTMSDVAEFERQAAS
jgi:hypothetical protein